MADHKLPRDYSRWIVRFLLGATAVRYILLPAGAAVLAWWLIF
jgi:hypothetical protein